MAGNKTKEQRMLEAVELKRNQVKISSGEVITVDIYAISHREAIKIVALSNSFDEEDKERLYEMLSKMANYPDLADLPHPDYRKVSELCWKLIKDPLGSDPN